MSGTLTAKAEVFINASPERVWDALTKPELVKQYLFGTDMVTDWKVGSAITYSGVWEGKSYQDKGEVVHFEPHQRIVSTYWSGFSGKPDVPENYQLTTYQLTPEKNGTRLQVTQEGHATEESAAHSNAGWAMALEKMKDILEG